MTKRKKAEAVIRQWTKIKHEYTAAETLVMNKELLQSLNTFDQLNASAKSTAADYKAKIKAETARFNELRQKIASGYETQDVEATVEMDRKTGKKTYYRHNPGGDDHGKRLHSEPMTEADYSLLPLDEQQSEAQNILPIDGTKEAKP